MAKDALGPWLQQLSRSGVDVTVQEPDLELGRAAVRDAGFRTYSRLTDEEVLNGDLARIVTRHDLQISMYSIANSTVSRRVKNGLSSRFSLGTTAPTPHVLSPEARSADAWLRPGRGGMVVSRPEQVADGLAALSGYRQYWHEHHASWSAEGKAEELREIAG
jgi:hypothetical protein